MNPYIARISSILGTDVSDETAKLNFNWNNHVEGRALIQKIRMMQKELRILKQEINAEISVIRSDFISSKNQVGKGFGAELAKGFFGRKTAGSMNVSQRDSLRREQERTLAPYESSKAEIDRILATLDGAKGKIELSPEYQIRQSKQPQSLQPPELPLQTATRVRYYLYLAGEVKGPYTHEQIAVLRDTGVVNDQSQCCLEGSENWDLIHDLGN